MSQFCSQCCFTQEQRATGGCPLRFPELHCPIYDKPSVSPPAPSQTGTSRTDEFYATYLPPENNMGRGRDTSCDADIAFARQLERELDEMTQEMLRIAALNAQHVGELSQAKRDAERQWIPIGSAPSEQEVLITQAGSAMVWCAYRLEDEWYLPGDDASFVVTPTHWMPLPAALAKREGEE